MLTEENVLEKMSKVINLLRDCNVTLRWVILHCTPVTAIGKSKINLGYLIGQFSTLDFFSDGIKKIKQLRDLVLFETKYNPQLTLQFLLNVAQLELKVKELFRKVIELNSDIIHVAISLTYIL